MYLYIQFHGNPFSGNRVVPCQQTDVRTHRQDLFNSFISQLIERAYKPQIALLQMSLSAIFHMICI